MSLVEIHYTRTPDRMTVFRQHVVHRAPGCIVTLLPHAAIDAPLRVRGRTVLEPGAPVVWFTFPGLWHDIGRFHGADDAFTGIYANILTPVQFPSPELWTTTDLCLDVWLDEQGAELLDEDELASTLAHGWISAETGARARHEAAQLLARAAAGSWPPAVVEEWTLERAREVVDRQRGTRSTESV